MLNNNLMVPKPFSIATGVFHQPSDWSDARVAHFTRYVSSFIRDRLIIFLAQSAEDDAVACLSAMSMIYAASPLMLDVLVFPLDSTPTFCLDDATPLLPDKLGYIEDDLIPCQPETFTLTPVPHLLIAGTFDHLHSGHKLLLSAAAFSSTKKLTVALTEGEALLGRKKFKAAMQTLQQRTHAVSVFLSSLVPDLEIVFTVTTDVVGPAAHLDADAIAVTAETLTGADTVNQARSTTGHPPLKTVVLPILSPSTEKVSSTHVRKFIAHQAGGEAVLDAARQKWFDAGGDEEWWSQICRRYAEPWRHYHTLRHVMEIIGNVPEDKELHLAAFFHDLVYVPSESDNEDKSVAEFKRFAVNLPLTVTDFVTECITSSKSHLRQLNEVAPRVRVFLELDLAIIAASPDRYDEYAAQIQREYSPTVYTAEAFKAGRASFLVSLLSSLDELSVFTVEGMNIRAAENIRRELARY